VAISEGGIAAKARRWATDIDILGNRRPDVGEDAVAERRLEEDGFVVLVDEYGGDVDLDVDAEVINLDLEVTARWQGRICTINQTASDVGSSHVLDNHSVVISPLKRYVRICHR
jgi:hypothetical protein